MTVSCFLVSASGTLHLDRARSYIISVELRSYRAKCPAQHPRATASLVLVPPPVPGTPCPRISKYHKLSQLLKFHLISTLVFMAGFVVHFPANALDMAQTQWDLSSSSSLSLGERIFSAQCASCHSGGGNIIPYARARNLKLPALRRNGYADAPGAMVRLLREGAGSMPAYSAERISDEEANAVSVYVLKRAQENWRQVP